MFSIIVLFSIVWLVVAAMAIYEEVRDIVRS